jgi:hypothetical protein
MSLILEALKKLDRERDTSGRGFVVVAQAPWPARRDRLLRVAAIAVGAGALAGAAAWGAWSLLASRTVPARPVTAATTPQPAAAPATALPPPIWETAPAAARPAVARAVPGAGAPSPLASPAAASAAASPEEPPLLVIAPRTPASAAPLHLEAISARDGEPVAVINGRLVRKGETIEGALVTWIGPDGVEIEVDGKRRVIGF